MTKKTLLTFALLFTISCGYEETEDQSNVTSDYLTTACATGGVCGGKVIGAVCTDRTSRGTCQVNKLPNYCICK